VAIKYERVATIFSRKVILFFYYTQNYFDKTALKFSKTQCSC